MDHTLAIIKPDAVAAARAGKILAHLEHEGFSIRGIRFAHLTVNQAREFYAVHRDRPFFDSLVRFMTSGPVIPVALRRADAVSTLRQVIGATDSIMAAAQGRRRSTRSSGTPSRSNTGRKVARAVGDSFWVRERSASTP